MAKKDLPVLNLSIPEHKRHLVQHVRSLAGLYRVEFTRVRDQRSLSQNAYFHGVVLPVIAEGIRDMWGEPCDAARAKRIVKAQFLTRPICNPFGELVGTDVLSTSELDREEFSDFLEQVIEFAADHLGVSVPPAAHYEVDAPSPTAPPLTPRQEQRA